MENRSSGGPHDLPNLPYDYGALAPAITGEILELHHSKHHAAYVKGANDTLERLEEARDTEAFGSLVGLEKTFAFNLSGHVLHTIFWQNLSHEGAIALTANSQRPSPNTSVPSRSSPSSSRGSLVNWPDVTRRFDAARAGTPPVVGP